MLIAPKSLRTAIPLLLLTAFFCRNAVAQNYNGTPGKHLLEIYAVGTGNYSVSGIFLGCRHAGGGGVRYAFKGFGIGIGGSGISMTNGQTAGELFFTVNAAWRKHSASFMMSEYGDHMLEVLYLGRDYINGNRMTIQYQYMITDFISGVAVFNQDRSYQTYTGDPYTDFWTNTVQYTVYNNSGKTWRAGIGTQVHVESARGLFAAATIVAGVDRHAYSMSEEYYSSSGWFVPTSTPGWKRDYVRKPEYGLSVTAEVKAGVRFGKKHD